MNAADDPTKVCSIDSDQYVVLVDTWNATTRAWENIQTIQMQLTKPELIAIYHAHIPHGAVRRRPMYRIGEEYIDGRQVQR